MSKLINIHKRNHEDSLAEVIIGDHLGSRNDGVDVMLVSCCDYIGVMLGYSLGNLVFCWGCLGAILTQFWYHIVINW